MAVEKEPSMVDWMEPMGLPMVDWKESMELPTAVMKVVETVFETAVCLVVVSEDCYHTIDIDIIT